MAYVMLSKGVETRDYEVQCDGFRCELRIISDANQFYIETILEHHDVLRCFSQINTNPTRIDEEKRLGIFPFHDLNSPHGCNLCPPNMCKVFFFTEKCYCLVTAYRALLVFIFLCFSFCVIGYWFWLKKIELICVVF